MTITIEGMRRQMPQLKRYGEKGENSKLLPLISVELTRRLAGMNRAILSEVRDVVLTITRRFDPTDFLISRVRGKLSMLILSLKTSTFRT